MNIGKIVCLSCLIVASSHAVEIQNRSTLPVLIDTIIVSVNTGLDKQPSIKKRNISIAPHQTISHEELSGQAYAQVTQVSLVFNNAIYLFTVSPHHQSGSITIHTDGRVNGSEGITLANHRSATAPTRSPKVGPRMI